MHQGPTRIADVNLPLEILIISFDGYSDVWELCVNSFYQYWPDCPWPVNLLTNHKEYRDNRIKSLRTGTDEDWSSNLIKGLQMISSPYLLTLFDDLILKEKIDTAKVSELARDCVEKNYNYLRLRPSPPPDGNEYGEYGSLKSGAPYRVSLCTAIVKRETLLKLLEIGEHAWDFEKFATLRSAGMKDFYSTKKQIIPYYNAIEKRKWSPSILPVLAAHQIDYSKRGVFQQQENASWVSKLKHFIVFSIMPVFVRKLFYQLQKTFR